jgi:hypothetical protein
MKRHGESTAPFNITVPCLKPIPQKRWLGEDDIGTCLNLHHTLTQSGKLTQHHCTMRCLDAIPPSLFQRQALALFPRVLGLRADKQ